MVEVDLTDLVCENSSCWRYARSDKKRRLEPHVAVELNRSGPDLVLATFRFGVERAVIALVAPEDAFLLHLQQMLDNYG